jgi:hypothetical protein
LLSKRYHLLIFSVLCSNSSRYDGQISARSDYSWRRLHRIVSRFSEKRTFKLPEKHNSMLNTLQFVYSLLRKSIPYGML